MTADSSKRKARVLATAGRTLKLFDHELFEAKLASRSISALVGDQVLVSEQSSEKLVTQIAPRHNILTRTYGNQDKEIVANLNRLILVSAVGKLFNTVAIDRLLTLAFASQVPVSIVLNKVDLAVEPLFELYRKIGFDCFELSAKFGQGMQQFTETLQHPALELIALAGISGVGKSTILNCLIPQASSRTSEVSQKTGQGRQTTSQAIGHIYQRQQSAPLVLVDLPGSQHFGISHLDKRTVLASFPEFEGLCGACDYSDCMHSAEPKCAVKEALAAGQIYESRYRSYLAMLKELEEIPDSRRYRRS